eukprot:SAG31_NODE_4172_length_3511_cov_1.676143_2_plen_153_part_00
MDPKIRNISKILEEEHRRPAGCSNPAPLVPGPGAASPALPRVALQPTERPAPSAAQPSWGAPLASAPRPCPPPSRPQRPRPSSRGRGASEVAAGQQLNALVSRAPHAVLARARRASRRYAYDTYPTSYRRARARMHAQDSRSSRSDFYINRY